MGNMKIHETERGNTLLTHYCEPDFIAWMDMGNNVRLQVSWIPDNYPSLTIQTITRTDVELAAHINNNCQGWYANKCHVDGVNIDGDGFIAESEDEDATT